MIPTWFISRLKIDPDTGCWNWTGCRNKKTGYSQVGFQSKYHLVHRLAWRLHYGKPAPDGLLVCHRCDNRICCNPDHLFIGTYKQNTEDALKKGRMLGPRKLTQKQANEIRDLYASGARQQELAEKFGVHQGTISNVVLGKHYIR